MVSTRLFGCSILKTCRVGILLSAFFVSTASSLEATPVTFYVRTTGSDGATGLSWAAAKQTIQSAVDLAQAGDTVVVSNGVYATGTRATPGASLLCRVVVDKAITVQSANGAGVTTISGAVNSSTVTNGDAAVRCVYLGADAVLTGFTLSNGHTRGSTGNAVTEQRGGAVYSDLTSSIVNNCILTGSSAHTWGGAAEGCTLNNCLITGNWAGQGGGGADASTMNNCTVTGNTGTNGGGTQSCTLKNCIVYFNTGSTAANAASGSMNYSCTTPSFPSGSGNITANPLFVNSAAGNYRLQSGSPCIGTGNNINVAGTTDLDGNPRIVNTTVDMGAYEASAPSVTLVTSTSGVSVPEGNTATFQVKLSAQPTGNTTVTVGRNAGDTDISVTGGASLTFTTSNWGSYQTVTLSAAQDNADVANGTATIRCSSTGLANVDVTATEADNDTTLTVTAGTGGSTTPSGATVVTKGAATSISATAIAGYTFANWTYTSGSATFGNANIASTTATITAPATVRANFNANTVLIVTSASGVSVPEGSTATFQVKLSAQPTGTKTVAVAYLSGDADISVTGGASLSFTTANWNTYQTVTLAAAEDVDSANGAATIRCSSSGLANVDVTATETDNDTAVAPLHITGLTLGASTVGVTAQADTGVAFCLQRSTNLVDWVSVGNYSAGATLSVARNASLPRCFYRLQSFPNLVVNGGALPGEIEEPGDMNWYLLDVTVAGTYTIDATVGMGPGALTDTIMWLYGPNSQSTQIAYNDDFGGLSSRISQTLNRGIYYVKIVGFGELFGSYSILVTR